MDLNQVLAQLKAEKEAIEEAVAVLTRLAMQRGKRRGRPPKWMSEVKRRGRPIGSKNKPKAPTKAQAPEA